MNRQRILFVTHCLLNPSAKVSRNDPSSGKEEEAFRRDFFRYCSDQGIGLIQLPCPEFTLYGPNRWGHTKQQFNHPFFREHARQILQPYVQQMLAYLQPGEEPKFKVLGVIGVEASPSCGVSRTCSGDWGGEFSRREDLEETLAKIQSVPESGVFMEVLQEMMKAKDIVLPVIGLDPNDKEALYDLLRSGME